MHAFNVLGDPARRCILEVLAQGEQPAGAVTEVIRKEFGISQPAVSQHPAGAARVGLRDRAA
jgi:DNA-binding transcriptional ArsR family regulator